VLFEGRPQVAAPDEAARSRVGMAAIYQRKQARAKAKVGNVAMSGERRTANGGSIIVRSEFRVESVCFLKRKRFGFDAQLMGYQGTPPLNLEYLLIDLS
jgi:hypothetical protein